MKRILIVEDDAVAQLTLAQYLVDLGFPDAVVVNNGKDALTALEENKDIALTFLDIRIMGEWDGIATAQRIKKIHPQLPLVFLTASTDQETFRRAQHVDPFSIIRKPYDHDTLRLVVSEALHHPVEARIPKKASALPSAPALVTPDVGVSVVNAEGVIVSTNAEFCRIHRCTEAEATNRVFTDFFPKNIRKFTARLYRDFLAGNTEEGDGLWTIVDQRGASKQVSLTLSRLLLSHQQQYVVSTFIDVSQQQEDAERLESVLEKKDAFAREIHHRVKNNLNVISGLFYLQAEKIKDRPDVYHLFQESISRIKVMSVIHEQLYNYENYTTIDLSRYVQLLADSVQSTYQHANYVTLRVTMDPIELDVDRAVACGLILNEIMTNSLKYAFPQRSADAQVLIKGTCHHRVITLTVKDNGIGLPQGFDINQAKTLGIQLIKTLIKQLGGFIEVQNDSPGVSVCLRFGA